MAQQDINIGAANGGTGDDYFTAFTKAQSNFDELYAGELFTKRVLVNSLADMPSPISNVITLVDQTQYLIANDIDFGANSIKYGANCVVSGIDTIVITLSYIGIAPFFAMTNVTGSIKNMNVLHPNSDLLSFSDSASNVIRVVDVTATGKKTGTLTGSTSLGRFTNYSPTLSDGGATFAGTWTTFLYDSSFGIITAGVYVNLAAATFNGLALIRPSIVLAGAGATYLSGLPTSGNINVGGGATIKDASFFGPGTVLAGVTAEDDRWEFYHNNVIQDTHPDGLLSMQANATATVITVATTPVLVAGVWVVERTSQAAGTTAGRITQTGGKPLIAPITGRVSVEPASGTNKLISVFIAINGAAVMASKATVKADAGSPLSVAVIWQEVLAVGDYVELFVSNDSDTVNVLASSAVSRMN